MDNSFIYAIHSYERENIELVPIDYDLNFGGFASQYEDFKVEITDLKFTRGFDNSNNSFFVIALDDLASDGVFCQRFGGNSVLFPISISFDGSGEYVANKNVFFNVKNCRLAKRIKMRLLKSNLDTVTRGVDINAGTGIEWLMTMKVTPIVN